VSQTVQSGLSDACPATNRFESIAQVGKAISVFIGNDPLFAVPMLPLLAKDLMEHR